MHRSSSPIYQVLLAAALFGVSAPFSKLLLGEIDPLPLAALLYMGSGAGAWSLLLAQRVFRKGKTIEANITRTDFPWLLGAMLAGGIGAPILLLWGLNQTPASTTSLLLNFEGVATTLIAIYAFKEAVDRRILWAMALITLASILLSWKGGAWGLSSGALGVIGACFLWGVDNNLTRHISAKDPLVIVGVKGMGAGVFSLVLTIVFNKPLPGVGNTALAVLLGAVSYGLSIQFFILALRGLGAARAGTLFGIAPFIGALLSLALLRETPQMFFWAALPVMLAGAWLMLTENHAHHHLHVAWEHCHAHAHPDEHHEHICPENAPLVNSTHAHPHIHAELAHSHAHAPDLHHRHKHGEIEPV